MNYKSNETYINYFFQRDLPKFTSIWSFDLLYENIYMPFVCKFRNIKLGQLNKFPGPGIIF